MHGSVAVRADDPTRYVAYAQFWPTADVKSANAFDNVNDHMAKRSVCGVSIIVYRCDDNSLCECLKSRNVVFGNDICGRYG